MENKAKRGRKTVLWVLGWVFAFPIPLTILLLRKKSMKAPLRYGILALAWLLYLLIILPGGKETDTDTPQPEVPQVIETAVPQESGSIEGESNGITDEIGTAKAVFADSISEEESPLPTDIPQSPSPTAYEEPTHSIESKIIPGAFFTLLDIPEYAGADFVEINGNTPGFTVEQITNQAYINFSALDKLGRTGAGMACLGPETLPTHERGVIGDIRPSGWHTVRYDELIADRYLYNRCHVIGYQLCSDNATPENLFTGTRYLNAGAMLNFETQVANYIEQTSNHVIYRCTPTYREVEDLVAYGVQMEAYSVEDAGRLQFNVFVFNVQPGIIIDYATGDSQEGDPLIGSLPSASPEPSATPESRVLEQEQEAPEVTYILNKGTKKFHYPNCASVSDIKAKNKAEFYGTREEAIEKGYVPCKRCNP